MENKELGHHVPGSVCQGPISTMTQKFKNMFESILGGPENTIQKKISYQTPLSNEDLEYCLSEDVSLQGAIINQDSLSNGNTIHAQWHDRDLRGIHFEISKESEIAKITFSNCNLSHSIFKSIGSGEIYFDGCDLSEVYFGNNSSYGVHTNNCIVKGIQIEGNDYQAAHHITDTTNIAIDQRSSSQELFCHELESHIDMSESKTTKKATQKGVIVLYDQNRVEHKLNVVFRKAGNLLGVIFLDTYEYKGDYLHKNCIYILDDIDDNPEKSQRNKLRSQIYQQITLGRFYKSANVFAQNAEEGLIVNVPLDSNDLSLKLDRIISKDRIIIGDKSFENVLNNLIQ